MASPAAETGNLAAQRAATWLWLRGFIRREVAPYPGRVSTVARMTVTATLVMIIVVAFRIPNPFLAALFSIILARDNLVATWRGARMVVLGFALATSYILLGMMLFRGFPICHFFWVIGSLYLIFFVMRAATNYGAAWAFSIPIGICLPVWDRSLPSQVQVAGTLWPILIIAVGAGVSVGTEALYRIFDRSDPLITTIDDMLLAVQKLAEDIADPHARSVTVAARVLQYHLVGSGRLRTAVQRAGLDSTIRAQRNAMISLTDRLVALAAEIGSNPPEPSTDDGNRLRALSQRLAVVRGQLREFGALSATPLVLEGEPSAAFPMVQEMERTLQLMTEVFQPDWVEGRPATVPERNGWRSLIAPDAFRNPEYQRFALAGCLAASVCYVLYNALSWPGISVSVLTCVVTALSTIGSSLQAQFLRLAGFLTGGVLMGISAQVLILPSLDTVFGFALFFAAGTAIAAWFATSGPRLSFFGVQVALAFYFINLQDFHVQTDLTIARDKLCGVLLGILAMGFIFDRFGTRSDAGQLHTLFAKNINMLSQLAVCPVRGKGGGAASQFALLRTQINDNFAGLASQTDTVQFEFEFRQRRKGEVAERDRIERSQPVLRCIYVLELSLLSHRGRRGVGPELTQRQNEALDRFLKDYGDALLQAGAGIAHEQTSARLRVADSARLLDMVIEEHITPRTRAMRDTCHKMVSSLLLLES